MDKDCNVLAVPGKVEDRFGTERYKNEILLCQGRRIELASCQVLFHLGQTRFIAGNENSERRDIYDFHKCIQIYSVLRWASAICLSGTLAYRDLLLLNPMRFS